jgi:flagellar biosynthetic protein FlhB
MAEIDERTEPATPRRREEARKRGQVVRSADLSSAVILLAAVVALQIFGRPLIGGLFGAASSVLEGLPALDGERENLLLHFGGALTSVLLGFLPFLLVVVVAALGINLAQVGILFTTRPLTPDVGRLDPITGMGRMFSGRSVVRLLAGILKVVAVGGVVTLTIWGERFHLAEFAQSPFEEMVRYGIDLMLTLSLRAALMLLVLAIFDYGAQRWQHDRELRMSKQEVREELKRYEGDPLLRERRRALQRRLALQHMVHKVSQATLVITNPAHLAVAIRHEKETMEMPVVIAKGARLLARRIRETAMDHGIPIVERKDLAQAIYASVEVGRRIPAEYHKAVAEILAYGYRLRGRAVVA